MEPAILLNAASRPEEGAASPDNQRVSLVLIGLGLKDGTLRHLSARASSAMRLYRQKLRPKRDARQGLHPTPSSLLSPV